MIIYGNTEWEKDLNDVIDLCKTWWKDSLFYKLYGVEYKVDINLFETVKNSGQLIYTLGRNENNKLISCYVGVKSPYMFNPSLMTASEIVWCVRKEERCFKNLVGLMRAVENLMKSENIMQWNLNVSNEEKYNSTCQFLESRGYDFMDRCFTKLKGERNG